MLAAALAQHSQAHHFTDAALPNCYKSQHNSTSPAQTSTPFHTYISLVPFCGPSANYKTSSPKIEPKDCSYQI